MGIVFLKSLTCARPIQHERVEVKSELTNVVAARTYLHPALTNLCKKRDFQNYVRDLFFSISFSCRFQSMKSRYSFRLTDHHIRLRLKEMTPLDDCLLIETNLRSLTNAALPVAWSAWPISAPSFAFALVCCVASSILATVSTAHPVGKPMTWQVFKIGNNKGRRKQ